MVLWVYSVEGESVEQGDARVERDGARQTEMGRGISLIQDETIVFNEVHKGLIIK